MTKASTSTKVGKDRILRKSEVDKVVIGKMKERHALMRKAHFAPSSKNEIIATDVYSH